MVFTKVFIIYAVVKALTRVLFLRGCRGEHCSPVPVCLAGKPPQKTLCFAKLAGEQCSPLRITHKIVITVKSRAGHTPPLPQKAFLLGGRWRARAPDEGDVSGKFPLISHLR